MTGEARGKVKLKAQVYLMPEKIKLNVRVYIHVKGYALARVTHLDIEREKIESLISKSGFLRIRGINGGIEIKLSKKTKFGKKKVSSLQVLSPSLDVVKKDEATFAFVGKKHSGIFIGFKREYVRKLEEIAFRLSRLRPL